MKTKTESHENQTESHPYQNHLINSYTCMDTVEILVNPNNYTNNNTNPNTNNQLIR